VDSVLQTLSTFVIALSVLLFFGPIIVIVSLIGNLQIGPLNVDLRRKSKAVRGTLAFIGLASWLLLYIPLVILAFRAVSDEPVESTPPAAVADAVISMGKVPDSTAQILGDDLFGIDAQLGWQDTGIHIEVGDEVSIQVESGTWTRWLGQRSYTGGEGDPGYVCGFTNVECLEPLPLVPAGALVGRIGGMIFEVGNEKEMVANESGNLFLRINDVDGGLFDNDGSLSVKVTK
jgi:hypothetical protein